MGFIPMNNSANTETNEGTEEPIVVKESEGALERELFGKWTVALRNIGGIFAVVVVCLMGLFNSYTIYLSVTANKVWPSETSMFIMVVGPVVASWSWMSVNKILQTILGGEGGFTKLRERAAKIIAPTKSDAQQ